jgi:hypothetical protein
MAMSVTPTCNKSWRRNPVGWRMHKGPAVLKGQNIDKFASEGAAVGGQ